MEPEKTNLRLALDRFSTNINLIKSPDIIEQGILKDFQDQSKPVNLITMGKKKWAAKMTHFDKEYLYVIAPPALQAQIGALILVEFTTANGNYIMQAILSRYIIQPRSFNNSSLILSLKFLDPRSYKRYPAPFETNIYFSILDQNASWIHDEKSFIVRTMEHIEGDQPGISITETIGMSQWANEIGQDAFSYLDKEMEELKTGMLNGKLENISLGGCALKVADKNIASNSILFVSFIIDIEGTAYKYKHLEASLFAIVCNVIPMDGNLRKYGLSFFSHINQKTLGNFLEKLIETTMPLVAQI